MAAAGSVAGRHLRRLLPTQPDAATDTEYLAGRLPRAGRPELIAQLLEKLLDNALDFTPDDGEIRLSLARTATHLCLAVTNQGSRLPATLPRQLFDSLVSVRPKSSSSPHLGLGLYIVRLIAEFHQGQIDARNLEDGSGVTFELQLPLAPPADSA